ncbi:hypothetical protein [Novipirellula caenicola]|uniref:hypothetical protein n=1 Tax=Novipirellula caenicola TaxID=1536901 RepID=UPI0031EC2340
MKRNPYTPPTDSIVASLPVGPTQSPRSRWATLAIIACYAWLAILFFVWLQDGLNVLIERQVAFRIKTTLLTFTAVAGIAFAKLRFTNSRVQVVAYTLALVSLQMLTMNALTNHTVEHFPF